MRTDFCCFVISGKLQLKYVLAAKIDDINNSVGKAEGKNRERGRGKILKMALTFRVVFQNLKEYSSEIRKWKWKASCKELWVCTHISFQKLLSFT